MSKTSKTIFAFLTVAGFIAIGYVIGSRRAIG